jgi:ATP-binding cassette subfamily B (MDR/TAP) protein 1
LNHNKYIGSIFRQFGIDESKLIQTPFMTNFKLSKDMGPLNDASLNAMHAIPFQNVIGSLMYAMVCTKVDIAHAMGVVS